MKKRSLFLAIIFILPLISAYSFDYYSPSGLIENEWMMFTIVAVILTAAIYYPIMKKTNSSGTSAIVAAGLALLLAVPITNKGLLLPFLDPSLVDYIAIAAIAIGIIFILYRIAVAKNAYGVMKFSLWRLVWAAIIIAILLPFFKAALPEKLLYGPIGDYMDIMGDSWGIAGILLGALIVFWLIKRAIRRKGLKLDERAKRSGELSANRAWGQ
jgi:hypothetical protein